MNTAVAGQEESSWGEPLVTIAVRMTNQDGAVLATAKVDVELPRCAHGK